MDHRQPFEPLESEDVISVSTPNQLLINHNTFTVAELTSRLAQQLNIRDEKRKGWIDQGVPCRVLRSGQTWQRGSIRIRLEFVPNPDPSPEQSGTPEGSPLDHFRQPAETSEEA
ncbi:MAG: KGK domain-containing protein [Leptolyngbya sp. DLM2.Bin15]|nr:MAG: KGK domain-containing protein [Leptolyngbya sp. DLM2.Bin15]